MEPANDLDSTYGLSDDELTERFKASIRIDDEIRRIKGAPTARYDADTGKAYLEYPGGRREYVANSTDGCHRNPEGINYGE